MKLTDWTEPAWSGPASHVRAAQPTSSHSGLSPLLSHYHAGPTRQEWFILNLPLLLSRARTRPRGARAPLLPSLPWRAAPLPLKPPSSSSVSPSPLPLLRPQAAGIARRSSADTAAVFRRSRRQQVTAPPIFGPYLFPSLLRII